MNTDQMADKTLNQLSLGEIRQFLLHEPSENATMNLALELLRRAEDTSDDTKRLDWLDGNDCGDAIEDFLNNATPIREAIDAAMRKEP